MPTIKPIRILLVEDSAGDTELTRVAIQNAKITNGMISVTDGLAAIEFLRNPDNPRPNLILLDLNLPRMNGHEVLEILKNDDDLKKIPVCILTTSKAHLDIDRGYSNHANAYIVKPLDFNQFVKVVQDITNFWITIVELP